MAPARQQRPAPKNQHKGAHVIEPIQPSPELVQSPPREGLIPMPLGAWGMPVPPPMFLAGGLAPYPPHYGVPGPYPAFAAAPPPQLTLNPPPPDTIYQGTVANFGFAAKDGTSSRHCYGFIKIDHSGNEVFVSEQDAPDGYLSMGDRCEFRIVDARRNNRRTGPKQWKATDVVCIQRAAVISPNQQKKANRAVVVRRLKKLVKANGGEMSIIQMAAKYQDCYDQPLDVSVRALGYPRLSQFIASEPGLTYVAASYRDQGPRADLVRLAPELNDQAAALDPAHDADARERAGLGHLVVAGRLGPRAEALATLAPLAAALAGPRADDEGALLARAVAAAAPRDAAVVLACAAAVLDRAAAGAPDPLRYADAPPARPPVLASPDVLALMEILENCAAPPSPAAAATLRLRLAEALAAAFVHENRRDQRDAGAAAVGRHPDPAPAFSLSAAELLASPELI